MTYEEAVKMMKKLGKEAENESAEDYSYSIQPSPKYPEIILEYPACAPKRRREGWERKNGDYRMKYKMPDSEQYKALSHFDICEALFQSSKGKYEAYYIFLEDVCRNGTNIDISKHESVKNAEKLAQVLFWLTVQEDINYPPDNKNKGHVLSFYRFFEAVYAAEYDESIMDELEKRCDGQPKLYNIGNVPHPSYYAFTIDF